MLHLKWLNSLLNWLARYLPDSFNFTLLLKTSKSIHTIQKAILVLAIATLLPSLADGQNQPPGSPLGIPGEQQGDTASFGQSNTDEWANVPVKIQYKYLNSDKIYIPDSSIHTFHRRPFSQPWNRDLGNFGTAIRNLQFTPHDRLGPTLGYHAFDPYNISTDSLRYYHTTAPYSEFQYGLGSKLEQNTYILHTQNIKPNWNAAVTYNKIISQGYYLLQRTNQDHAALSTNYTSINQRYKLNFGVVYNKSQQDENGGIVTAAQLDSSEFNDRSNIDIVFQDAAASASTNIPRSLINNVQRDYAVLLDHSYAWGTTDTLYNEDSTSMQLDFVRRFSIGHQFRFKNEQLTYKDNAPDSLRYVPFFNNGFTGENDSVYVKQKHNVIDNRFMLNGFFGKKEKPLQFSAGVGIRFDRFSTVTGIWIFSEKSASNYVLGSIKKEALHDGEWFYDVDALFYVTGSTSGSSVLKGEIGKSLKGFGVLEAGIQQNINAAPYNYTNYYNSYDTILNSFSKETITKVHGKISSEKYQFEVGVASYLIGNYFYMNELRLADQYTPSFNTTQVWARKAFSWKGVVLDNEVMYQQKTAAAPINIPQFMGRHQLSYERYIFKNALKIATGVEVRYHSAYYPAGYSPIYNRFYYQDTLLISNQPAASIFFNFKIKKFRAYVMLDQGQQFFTTNLITAPIYPAQNAMIRFGFNWVLIK